jgi:hypothetical protein
MTSRERNLALVVLAILFLFGGTFFGYYFYLEPLRQKNAGLARLRNDIEDRRNRIEQIERQRPRLERWRYLSLPGDVNLAQREYDNYLRDLLRDSGFSAESISRIDTKQPDTRSSPTLPGKKEPIYTVVSFNVVARGQLASLVKLLQGFYQTGCLHRIKTLVIQRPQTSTSSQRQYDLDINLSIEALIVHGAMPIDRALVAADLVAGLAHGPTGLGVLLASAGPRGPAGPGLLADPPHDLPRQYASIADKNIFFGPPPPPPPARPPERPAGTDMTQFTFLTDIVRSDARSEAFLYDRYNNSRTRLRGSTGYDSFRIRDSNGETQVQGRVVRIDDRDIVFRAGDQYYLFHVGQSLKEAMAKPLSPAERKELSLPEPKGEAKEPSKKEL